MTPTAAELESPLARENVRLRGELLAREEQLRRARARAADAAEAARRALERDLHDGAQQQLVAAALDLRRLLAVTEGTELAAALAEVADKLADGLAELRDLARGLRPALLDHCGLAAAVRGLADRLALPVVVEADLGERLDRRVEATAYFVVAEALTNVVRHARARQIRVELVRRARSRLVVTVEDDGVGGADATRGTGLFGLRERLAYLDGTLAIESRPGAGTRLIAVIPHCAAAPTSGGQTVPRFADVRPRLPIDDVGP